MRISDWSSDVCSSDLFREHIGAFAHPSRQIRQRRCSCCRGVQLCCDIRGMREEVRMLRYYKSALFAGVSLLTTVPVMAQDVAPAPAAAEEVMRSGEHTSELQSLMRISYAVFCLKKKKKKRTT